MGFDCRDIRPSMDVFTRDNAYLGAVLAVVPGELGPRAECVDTDVLQESQVNGELLGPMPTQAFGNRGPSSQGAAALYASPPDDAEPIGRGSIIFGTWWGLIACRTVPIEDVLNVSLERVILKQAKDQLTYNAPAGAPDGLHPGTPLTDPRE